MSTQRIVLSQPAAVRASPTVATSILPTWWVDPAGDDAATGEFSDPWKTPQKAFDTIGAGERAMFKPGEYTITQTVLLDSAGTNGNWRIFESQDLHGAKWVGPTNDLANVEDLVQLLRPGWIYTDFSTKFIGLDFQGGYRHTLHTIHGAYLQYINCKVHGAGKDTVKYAPDATDTPYDGHNLIDGCEIYDTSQRDATLGEGVDNTSCNYLTIQDTHFHDILGTEAYAVYNKKHAQYCIIERCRADTCRYGFAHGESTPLANSIIRNNLLWDIQGAPFMFAGAQDCYIYNNTAYNTATVKYGGCRVYPCENANTDPLWGRYNVNIKFFNNIVVINNASTNVYLWFTANGTASATPNVCPGCYAVENLTDLDSDYNYYYNLDVSLRERFRYAETGNAETSIEDWRTYTSGLGQELETNSDFADPDFVSVDDTSADFLKLNPTSPCRNAGVSLATGTDYERVVDDYAGNARPLGAAYDIGAYEFVE
jgi:hypothetical protein